MKPLKLLPSAMILASVAVLLVMTQEVLLPRQEKAFGGRTWIV